MVAKVRTVAFHGVEVIEVETQVTIASGLPAFTVVGLPDKAVAESRERVRAALASLGLGLPPRRITVNLAPADVLKEGSHFDLPIALVLLAAMDALPADELGGYMALGEVALDGSLTSVAGVLLAALAAASRGSGVICPAECGGEAAWAGEVEVIAAPSLLAIVNHFKGTQLLPPPEPRLAPSRSAGLDLADVKGQESAKRALEIAAAGGHSALLVGPPGAGKTMLAKRMPGLLPAPTFEEALEATSIWSVAGRLRPGQGLLTERPFRAPHHTISVAGLIGGGSPPRPGEVSLAHNGLLFLDELPEFGRAALEALRQPLEDGEVAVVRARGAALLPSRFMLIAAMNPCPCGYEGQPRCQCRIPTKQLYRRRVSGPILDRIDLHVEASALKPAELAGMPSGDTSAKVRERVEKARALQLRRFRGVPRVHANAQLRGRMLRELCRPSSEARSALAAAMDSLQLSARAHDRVLKLARTIADLEDHPRIEARHVLEAVQYRCLDRPVQGREGPALPALHLARQAALQSGSPDASSGASPEGT
jgi:magnesium chelatase family protein